MWTPSWLHTLKSQQSKPNQLQPTLILQTMALLCVFNSNNCCCCKYMDKVTLFYPTFKLLKCCYWLFMNYMLTVSMVTDNFGKLPKQTSDNHAHFTTQLARCSDEWKGGFKNCTLTLLCHPSYNYFCHFLRVPPSLTHIERFQGESVWKYAPLSPLLHLCN